MRLQQGTRRRERAAALGCALALGLGGLVGVVAPGCGRKPAGPGRDPQAEARAVAAASANAASAARLERGAASYAKYCALCHGRDAGGYAADNAPSLRSPTFLASASDDFLRKAVREGRLGTAMAAYAVELGGPIGDDELNDLIAFLRSKGPPYRALPTSVARGDAAAGAGLYEGLCQPCHGTPTERRSAVHLANASFLASASDEFLRHAITNGRPGTPMISFAGTLRPSEIDAIIAYVRTWDASPTNRVKAEAVPDGPVVINPSGKAPKFTLREGRYVPAEQVKNELEAKRRMVIIDARTTPDWAMTHIPGAISVPYHGFARLDDLPRDGTWVLAYCACPHHASGVVVDELRKRGFKNTAIIDEGILEWQRRGYPTEGTGPVPPAPPPVPGASASGGIGLFAAPSAAAPSRVLAPGPARLLRAVPAPPMPSPPPTPQPLPRLDAGEVGL